MILKKKDTEESKLSQVMNFDQEKYIINGDSIGDIFLGEKYDPDTFKASDTQLEGVDDCILATSKKYPEYPHSLYFQFVDDVLTGISISSMGDNEMSFESYANIKIGDTTDTVLKRHGRQPDEVFNNIYSDEPIFIYWTDSSKKIGMRYDILDEKVIGMGLHYSPHIHYLEGCG